MTDSNKATSTWKDQLEGWRDKFSKLDGFELIMVPLLYQEALAKWGLEVGKELYEKYVKEQSVTENTTETPPVVVTEEPAEEVSQEEQRPSITDV